MSNFETARSFFPTNSNTKVARLSAPIYAEVIFGAPGKMCSGAGVCKILPVEHVRVHWKCPNARAWLSATTQGSISLTFDRNTLSSALYTQYFGTSLFQVEEAYSVPNSLLSLLNIHSFTIEPGQYSVQVSARFLTIYF